VTLSYHPRRLSVDRWGLVRLSRKWPTWTHGSNLTVTQGYTNRLWVNSITATGQVP
jgi:hypothetical protein